MDLSTGKSVEVWAVWLDASETENRALRSLLCAEEILRADRFANEALRASYQTSHGLLRVLLSRYVQRDPRDIEFESGWAGKPVLKGDFGMHFNMSHSGALAVYAITTVCPVGVDIEQVRNLPDLERIAEHHFCPAETSELLSIAEEAQRRDAFFRCWTRKESYIKAVGDGLSLPLDQFQVTLLPNVPARLIQIGHNRHAAAAWRLHHLAPANGYVGALAYPIRCQDVTVHSVLHAQEFVEII